MIRLHRDYPFAPDALLVMETAETARETLEIAGINYRRVWAAENVTLFAR